MRTHSGRENVDGMRVFLTGTHYIGAQPDLGYRDWLSRIEFMNQRLAGSPAKIGYRNHSHLVRWYRAGWRPRDIVNRLHEGRFR